MYLTGVGPHLRLEGLGPPLGRSLDHVLLQPPSVPLVHTLESVRGAGREKKRERRGRGGGRKRACEEGGGEGGETRECERERNEGRGRGRVSMDGLCEYAGYI